MTTPTICDLQISRRGVLPREPLLERTFPAWRTRTPGTPAGCGAVHDDYCDNCGRWVSLPATEHATLSEVDAVCEHGRAPHEHPSAEKIARINALTARWQA